MKVLRPDIWTAGCALLLGALICGHAYAEDQPGRGLQMLEKNPQPPVIEQETKKPAPEPAAAGRKLLVKKFRFEGNTLFSNADLEKEVAAAEGKELTMDELKSAADVITGKYRDEGYLISYALVPQQTVTDGVVTIRVVEGKVGQVVVTGNKSYSDSFIRRHLKKVQEDPTLEEHTLEKQLLILNDYPSLTVKAMLKPGQHPGTTDVVAAVTDRFPIAGFISYDNFGSSTTSKHRASAGLDLGNLLLSGDLLMLRGTLGLDKIDLDKFSFGRVEYVIPVGGRGTQIGAYYTNTIYAAGESLAPLEISGRAKIAGLYLDQVVLKERDSTLRARAGFEYSSIKDNLLGKTNDEDEIRKLNLSLAYEVTDRFLGRNFVGFGYSRGLGDFMGGSLDDSNASRQGANDNFNKFNLDLMRIQKLPGYNHLVLRGSGQYSPQRLFLAEQFIVGGMGTVRGVDPASITGDSGLFGSAELVTMPVLGDTRILSQRLGDTLKFALFTDYGKVYTTRARSTESTTDHLWSVGAGARLYVTRYFSATVDWAVPSRGGSFNGHNSKTYIQAKFSF